MSGGTISHLKYHQPSEASSTIGSFEKFELLPFPARAVNDKQEEVTNEITRANKSLEKAHKLLVLQFLKIAASTEALIHRLARILEQFKYGRIGISQDGQRGHARADTPGSKLKHKELRSKSLNGYKGSNQRRATRAYSKISGKSVRSNSIDSVGPQDSPLVA